MEMHINESVWVKLTPYGEKVYLEWHASLKIPHRLSEPRATTGYMEFPLWELMNIFGPALYNGAPQMVFAGGKVHFNWPGF